MQVVINKKKYGFIWGTKCLIDTQKDLGVDINTFLGSVGNPEVLTSLIYNGLLLWCKKNGEDAPFSDYEDFILSYDSLFSEDAYNHIVTDLLESLYMGQELHQYISKIYGIEFSDIDNAKEAKKKYLLTLEKSKSTSRAGAGATKKSSAARSKNMKSQNTATS